MYTAIITVCRVNYIMVHFCCTSQLLETQAQIELLEEERKRLITDLAEQKVTHACTNMCILK